MHSLLIYIARSIRVRNANIIETYLYISLQGVVINEWNCISSTRTLCSQALQHTTTYLHHSQRLTEERTADRGQFAKTYSSQYFLQKTWSIRNNVRHCPPCHWHTQRLLLTKTWVYTTNTFISLKALSIFQEYRKYCTATHQIAIQNCLRHSVSSVGQFGISYQFCQEGMNCRTMKVTETTLFSASQAFVIVGRGVNF